MKRIHKPPKQIKLEAVKAAVAHCNSKAGLLKDCPGYSVSIGTRADRLKGHYTPEQVINVWFKYQPPEDMHYKVSKGKTLVGSFLLNADSMLIEKFSQNDYICLDLADVDYLYKVRMVLDSLIAQHKFLTKFKLI